MYNLSQFYSLIKVFIIHIEIFVQKKPVGFAVLSNMFHNVFDTALMKLGLMGLIM